MGTCTLYPCETGGVVRQVYMGETTASQARDESRVLVDYVLQQRARSVILDVRESLPLFEPADLITILNQEYGRMPRGLRVAYVMSMVEHQTEQMIVETLAFNHGLEVRIFSEMSAAETWASAESQT